jgi:hypothetical protein
MSSSKCNHSLIRAQTHQARGGRSTHQTNHLAQRRVVRKGYDVLISKSSKGSGFPFPLTILFYTSPKLVTSQLCLDGMNYLSRWISAM